MPGFRSALDVIHFARGTRSDRAGTVAWIVAGRVRYVCFRAFLVFGANARVSNVIGILGEDPWLRVLASAEHCSF